MIGNGMVGRLDTWTVETCSIVEDRSFFFDRRTGVRALIVVMKQGNSCGAKGGRKVNVKGAY